MITLLYGDQELKVDEDSMLLTDDQLKILLNGRYVINTGIPADESNKIQKTYYLGVIFELFKKNYHPAFSYREIYAMIFSAYPIFLNLRQAEATVANYFILKENHNVFARAR